MSFGVFSEFKSIDKDDFSTEISWTKKKPAIFYNKLVSLFILLQIIFSF
ncbi:hypothetical protein D356_00677 [Enterococcus faecium SD2A-2]|uniref:Uncharacterized protein n=1 Tax=Enterococcus faecium SD2A-2 TaxID=1244154 RepID=A0AB73ABL4_ENTFC|nr:hypothetical protein D356_00677 [Enterococcus faecium SD2A-2]MBL4989141.1 hypothetical protein [Enterococcus lactis]MBL4991815.1 hypothetical protein [Enterococcus lactis]